MEIGRYTDVFVSNRDKINLTIRRRTEDDLFSFIYFDLTQFYV